MSGKREKIYFGFLGGEGGNYFDADYFEVIENDNEFSWEEAGGSYASDRKFKSKRAAIQDAIKTMTPDDGSKIITGSDPDKLYDKIMHESIEYWIQYGNSEKDSKLTERLSEQGIISLLEKYQDEYLYVKVHSSDNDYSANYNF